MAFLTKLLLMGPFSCIIHRSQVLAEFIFNVQILNSFIYKLYRLGYERNKVTFLLYYEYTQEEI